jgi:dihydroorotate dehydrogenase (NAD+) catalytic subunit
MPDLSVTIAGITLKNPVLPASGTYEPTDAFAHSFSPSELGAIINKTVTLHPQSGNPPPRVWETPCGLLNSIGIPSKGINHFISTELPQLKKLNDRLIISIAGFSIRDFVELAELIQAQACADFIELNLSCPNLKEHTIWSQNVSQLSKVIKEVKKQVKLPLIAKLTPNVTEISEIALAAQDAGADALALANTYYGMAIDILTKTPALGNVIGGLSGPAIRPLTLHAVYTTYKKVDVPIIGMGGITSWKDAIEYFLAGATAIGVGMYNFVDPLIMKKIISGVDKYLNENGLQTIKEIIGLAHKE